MKMKSSPSLWVFAFTQAMSFSMAASAETPPTMDSADVMAVTHAFAATETAARLGLEAAEAGEGAALLSRQASVQLQAHLRARELALQEANLAVARLQAQLALVAAPIECAPVAVVPVAVPLTVESPVAEVIVAASPTSDAIAPVAQTTEKVMPTNLPALSAESVANAGTSRLFFPRLKPYVAVLAVQKPAEERPSIFSRLRTFLFH